METSVKTCDFGQVEFHGSVRVCYIVTPPFNLIQTPQPSSVCVGYSGNDGVFVTSGGGGSSIVWNIIFVFLVNRF